VRTDPADQTVDLVDDRIDLALRMTRDPPQDAVVAAADRGEAGDLRLTGLYRAAHGDARARRMDLADHQCFSYLLTDDNVWRLADRQGKETDVPVRSRFQFNDIACMHDAVRNGHGLAILPHYICGADLASGASATRARRFRAGGQFRPPHLCLLHAEPRSRTQGRGVPRRTRADAEPGATLANRHQA
jgi:DNA-binding transcriptional LysR family regulator